MKLQRLDRFLTRLLKRSKKDIRATIASGAVQVNGMTLHNVQNNYLISTFCHITINEKIIYNRTAYYVLLHKPKGIVSATKDKEHTCVMDLFDFGTMPWTRELRLVGRLDRFTTGLLLLTNDSHWSTSISDPNKGTGGGKKVPKKYLVTTLKEIDQFEEVARQFQEGLYLPDNDVTCRPSLIERVGGGRSDSSKVDNKHQYYITLYEGKRHQVKCMINAISMHEEQDVRNRVIELHRESIGNLILDGKKLKEGEWRHLKIEDVMGMVPMVGESGVEGEGEGKEGKESGRGEEGGEEGTR